MFTVVAGATIVSLTLTYYWWTKVRIIQVRQDIFDVHDALFDMAADLGCLEDPAYRVARRRLNAAANIVGFLTLDFLFHVTSKDASRKESLSEEEVDPLPESQNNVLQAEIQDTLEWCVDRIVRSLFEETLSGVLLRLRFGMKAVKATLEDPLRIACYRWIASSRSEHLDQYASEQPPYAVAK
jgi:hypothetical protein